MSDDTTKCRNCGNPWDHWFHSFAGKIDDRGVPQIACHKQRLKQPCPNFNGANLLWKRLEDAESGAQLAEKTGQLAAAVQANNRLELANKQLKDTLTALRAECDQAADEIVKTEKKARADLAAARASAADDLAAKDAEYAKRLTDATARVKAAEAQAEAARQAWDRLRDFVLERAAADQAILSKLSAQVDETDAIQVGPTDVIGVEADDTAGTVSLDQMRTSQASTGAAPAVPPAPMVVAPPAPPTPIPPPSPKKPLIVVTATPAASAPTGPFCTCGNEAVQVVRWELRTGGYTESLHICAENHAVHLTTIHQLLDGMGDQLVNPPKSAADVRRACKNITPGT